MISSLKLLLPEILLSSTALLLLVIDICNLKKVKVYAFIISLISLAVALGMVLCTCNQGRAFGMIVVDPFSSYFKALAIVSCFLIFLLSEKDPILMGDQSGTFSALLLLSTVGTLFLSSSEDLLIFFIGLELTTIPLFIMAGYLRQDIKSSEGAIKFFLMGAFSTGIMIYGISYLYGMTGSTSFSVIRDWISSD